MCFIDLERFLTIPGVSGYSFFTIVHIRKDGNHEKKFDKLIFRGTKTIHLISGPFLGILCVQDTNLKVLLKVINEHLLLLLESGFSSY